MEDDDEQQPLRKMKTEDVPLHALMLSVHRGPRTRPDVARGKPFCGVTASLAPSLGRHTHLLAFSTSHECPVNLGTLAHAVSPRRPPQERDLSRLQAIDAHVEINTQIRQSRRTAVSTPCKAW